MDSSQFARHVAIAVVVVAAAGVVAGSPSPPPAAYYGEVTVNGDPLPAGTTVVARIDGESRGSITLSGAGSYGGAGAFEDKLKVNGSEADDGETVRFFVGDLQATETVTWHPEDVRELDLTFTDTEPPTARTGPDREAGVGQSVGFDGRDSSDSGAIVAYEWDFDDGTTATGPTPTNRYDTAGTYDVTLTVRDAAGQTDTRTVRVTVTDREGATDPADGDRSEPTTPDSSNPEQVSATPGTPSPMPTTTAPVSTDTPTVTPVSTATPTPGSVSPPTVTPSPRPTTPGTASATPSPSPTPTTEGGPGFGVLTALAAILAMLAVGRWR